MLVGSPCSEAMKEQGKDNRKLEFQLKHLMQVSGFEPQTSHTATSTPRLLDGRSAQHTNNNTTNHFTLFQM